MFCLLRKGTEQNGTTSSSSSSLDDDDDGDEMIGASLEEDLPSHKGKPTTGERQTTHHLLFRTTTTLCLLLLLMRAFPNNIRLNRRLITRDKNDRREKDGTFFLFLFWSKFRSQKKRELSFFVLLVQFWFFIEIGANLLPLLNKQTWVIKEHEAEVSDMARETCSRAVSAKTGRRTRRRI